MAIPQLAHYVADWPRGGDLGFVAEDGAMDVGAAWWRLFTEQDRGYGFVDEETPELAIGVVHGARGRGVGTLLLRALIDEAQRSALPALSLSVEVDNPAASLYERLGFETVGGDGGALTMVFSLGICKNLGGSTTRRDGLTPRLGGRHRSPSPANRWRAR